MVHGCVLGGKEGLTDRGWRGGRAFEGARVCEGKNAEELSFLQNGQQEGAVSLALHQHVKLPAPALREIEAFRAPVNSRKREGMFDRPAEEHALNFWPVEWYSKLGLGWPKLLEQLFPRQVVGCRSCLLFHVFLLYDALMDVPPTFGSIGSWAGKLLRIGFYFIQGIT